MLCAQKSASDQEQQRIAVALRSAERAFEARGAQFTKIRRTVFETLLQFGRPMGAYDLIRELEAKFDRKLSPPTVYRALDFLLEQRFVSRIETKNAFIPCTHPNHEHTCVFFICERCGNSAEVENQTVEALFEKEAAELGFRIGKRVIEMQGVCASCQTAADAVT